MASALAHPLVPLALAPWFRRAGLGPCEWLVGGLLSLLPDADIGAFPLGIPYGHVLGHRGLTHSLAAAAAAALALAPLLARASGGRLRWPAAAAYLFLSMASHGVLDAATDGGRGVAFLAPFDGRRWFLPWRPIEVSPISPDELGSARLGEILASEARWVGLPALAVFATGLGVRGDRRRRAPAGRPRRPRA